MASRALFLVLTCFAVAFAPKAAVADPFRVVILVNNTPITQFEIDARIDLINGFSGGNGDRETIRGQAIEALIDEALQLDIAEEEGMLPAREVTEESFANIAANNNLSSAEFAQRLRSEGINPDAFKARLRPQAAWNAVLGAFGRGEIAVSDEDLDERWAEIQADKGNNERLVTEVYLPGSSRSQANAVAARMRSSSNFADFARATSRSPLASVGGDLGWLSDPKLRTSGRSAVRGLAAGQVSSPIAGDGGFYIYGVRAVRPVGAISVETLFDVRELYFTLEAQGQSTNDAQKLQTLQNVFRRVDSCERFDQAMEVYGEGQSGRKGFVSLRDLPPIVAGVVNATEVGTFSQLIPQPGGASIIAVCGTSQRSEPLTKDMLRGQMVSERVGDVGAELMRDLRRRAYIEYR